MSMIPLQTKIGKVQKGDYLVVTIVDSTIGVDKNIQIKSAPNGLLIEDIDEFRSTFKEYENHDTKIVNIDMYGDDKETLQKYLNQVIDTYSDSYIICTTAMYGGLQSKSINEEDLEKAIEFQSNIYESCGFNNNPCVNYQDKVAYIYRGNEKKNKLPEKIIERMLEEAFMINSK